MSRLIASILLSVLLFPMGGVVYMIAWFAFIEGSFFNKHDESIGFLFAGLVTWVFVAWYWIAVWRRTVRWTPTRMTRTFYAALAAVAAGAVAGVATGALV